MNKMIKLISIALFFGTIALSSCSEDDGNGTPGGETPNGEEPSSVFVMGNAINSPEGRITYISTETEIGDDIVFNPSEGIEINGAARLMAPSEPSGFVIVGTAEDLTLTRWDLNEDNELVQGGRLSIAGTGATQIDRLMTYISETKAYFIDRSQGQIIIINPKEMVITGTISLPPQFAQTFDGFETWISLDRKNIVNGRLFLPVAHWLRSDDIVRQTTGVGIIDTQTDEVTYIEDDRLAAAIDVVKAENGDLYFGTALQSFADAEAKANGFNGGMIRINNGESSFDPDYFFEYPEKTASLKFSSEPNQGFITVLDESIQPWSTDFLYLDYFTEAWRVATIDVTTGQIAFQDELPNTAALLGYISNDRAFLAIREERNDGSNNRNITINEVIPGGPTYEVIYRCNGCAFVDEVAQVR